MNATRLGFIALCSLVAGLVVYGLVLDHRHRDELASLRGQLAQRDRTAEVQRGVYARLAVESFDLRKLLDARDTQVRELSDQLKRTKQGLLTVTGVALRWKHDYESLAQATQTTVPPSTPAGHARTRVDFDHDFGFIGVSGHTLTDPPEALVDVRQNRPLRLTLAVAQGEDGRWTTYVTSSEENVGVDISLSSVNPRLLSPRWYEGLALTTSMGVGPGGLVGLGASVRLGRFDVGPSVWYAGGVSPYYGATVSWRPFQRD